MFVQKSHSIDIEILDDIDNNNNLNDDNNNINFVYDEEKLNVENRNN